MLAQTGLAKSSLCTLVGLVPVDSRACLGLLPRKTHGTSLHHPRSKGHHTGVACRSGIRRTRPQSTTCRCNMWNLAERRYPPNLRVAR